MNPQGSPDKTKSPNRQPAASSAENPSAEAAASQGGQGNAKLLNPSCALNFLLFQSTARHFAFHRRWKSLEDPKNYVIHRKSRQLRVATKNPPPPLGCHRIHVGLGCENFQQDWILYFPAVQQRLRSSHAKFEQRMEQLLAEGMWISEATQLAN